MNIPRFFATRRNFVISVASAVLLSGCGAIHLLQPSTAPGAIYVLSPDFAAATDTGRVAWQMAVAAPQASASLTSDRIALMRGNVLDYYADAQWSDSTPDMTQTFLVDALEKGGAMGAVGKDADGIHAEFILQSQIRSFEAHYPSADAPPIAVIDIVVTIMTAPRGEIVATKEFRQEAPASANSVPAAVAAFNTAASSEFGEIAAWSVETATAYRKDGKTGS